MSIYIFFVTLFLLSIVGVICGSILIATTEYKQITVNIDNATCEYIEIANTPNYYNCYLNISYEVKGKLYNKNNMFISSGNNFSKFIRVILWYHIKNPNKIVYFVL